MESMCKVSTVKAVVGQTSPWTRDMRAMETVMRGGLGARRQELGAEWAGWGGKSQAKGRNGAPGSPLASPSQALAVPQSTWRSAPKVTGDTSS